MKEKTISASEKKKKTTSKQSNDIANKTASEPVAKRKRVSAKTPNAAKWKTEIKGLKQTIEDQKDKHLRLLAEFENVKKRNAKERVELYKTAGKDIVTDLLPVLDDFQRAIIMTKKENNEQETSGLKLISNKFVQVLKSNGLEEIATKVGDIFNADLHEAVSQIKTKNKKDEGKIIDVLEKGYQINGTTIRYPKVVVGK